MIKPEDLTGVSEDVARRVIVLARSIAPCIDTLEDGPGEDDPKPRADAIAILNGVAVNGGSSRPRHIKSERIGPGAAEYWPNSSWFSDDDRAALRSLCTAPAKPWPGDPIGQFPPASRAISRMWPEDC